MKERYTVLLLIIIGLVVGVVGYEVCELLMLPHVVAVIVGLLLFLAVIMRADRRLGGSRL